MDVWMVCGLKVDDDRLTSCSPVYVYGWTGGALCLLLPMFSGVYLV